MVEAALVIRNPRLDEVAKLAAVEASTWPNGLAGTEAQIRARLAVYPEGQWVAELAGEVLGVAASQRLTERFLQTVPVCFDALTDEGNFTRSHDPSGEILHLVSVSVARGAQGLGVGRKLVDHEIEMARAMKGVIRIVGVTRPRGFRRYDRMSIEAYVVARREDGRFLDPVLDFHLAAGAQLVSILPGYRPADADSRGYGVMIEYEAGEE